MAKKPEVHKIVDLDVDEMPEELVEALRTRPLVFAPEALAQMKKAGFTEDQIKSMILNKAKLTH